MIPVLLAAALVANAGLAVANFAKNNDDRQECSVSEAANLLGISEYTVKKKIREGDLNGHIVGKKYMIPIDSINEYSKKVGKSGQVLGEPSKQLIQNNSSNIKDSLEGLSEEIWNNPILLQGFIDGIKLQQEIIKIEIDKIELSIEIAKKNNNDDEVLELNQQIMDKKIHNLQIAQAVKICETQIHYLKDSTSS